MSRESEVESKLYHYLLIVLEKRGFNVEGVRFEEPKTQYPVNGRRADIAVILTETGKPLLIIETKRKIVKEGYQKYIRNIMPTSRVVIDQALLYAEYCGAPYFATTNGRVFALFSKPRAGEGFSFDKNRIVLSERAVISEKFAEEILITVARLHRRVSVAVTPLDWSFIIVLRDFVHWLSTTVEPLLQERLKIDDKFRERYEVFAEEVGYKPDVTQLAKEMSYVFMNKIVFLKVLERHYSQLGARRLRRITTPDSKSFLDVLNSFFNKAVETTGDFEPVFYTEFYDDIVIPDDPFVFEVINAFIEDMEQHKLEDLGSDVVGFIYEELVPAEERHALGQFYTPPPIAELITKWALRGPSDKVLDPGCGSGTFLVKAYGRLAELKGYKGITENSHKEILSQLYAFDINPFPVHLTALNLASRYITAPSTELNTIHSDFFRVSQTEKLTTSYVVKTPSGEIRRKIPIPQFDSIIANPPYTRWTEIPTKTRDRIKVSIGKSLTEYGLTAQVQRGLEPGIYIHFIMHGMSLLKDSGRMGMIVSDSWLQTDYGVDFGRFLLDHFKVKAVIDISARIFAVPLIGTCILLLERCESDDERKNNQSVFAYADLSEGGTLKVDEVLDAIDHPERYEDRYLITSVKQGEISANQKWINMLFDADSILDKINRRTARVRDLFEPSYGNASYLYLTSRGKTSGPRNLGTKEFFYLEESKVQRFGLKDYAHQAVTSARYAKWFVFTKDDWFKLKKRDAPCYLFICHEQKTKLPENVQKYIKWGETECRTMILGTRGGGKVCSEALACRAREKSRERFHGWYDLGGVEKAPIMAVRQSQYKTRFILQQEAFVTYDAMITFTPKVELNEQQLKAILAFLNSSFVQLYIESRARITGMGVAALEVKHAEDMPILDLKTLEEKEIQSLASLFEALESEARLVGGADTSQNVEKIWSTAIQNIDNELTRILKLPRNLGETTRVMAKSMMKRRLQRTKEPTPGAVEGEEPRRIIRPRRVEKTKDDTDAQQLDEFLK